MKIFVNGLSTFVLLLGLVWALLPGGFGLHNYKKSHAQPFIFIASALWWLLLLLHPLMFYWMWFLEGWANGWLMILLLLHIVFFSIFARDLGTR